MASITFGFGHHHGHHHHHGWRGHHGPHYGRGWGGILRPAVVVAPPIVPAPRPYIATTYPATPLSDRAARIVAGGIIAIITGVMLAVIGLALIPESAGASVGLSVIGTALILGGITTVIIGRIHG